MATLTPLGNMITVIPDEEGKETITKSGLIMTNEAPDKPMTGTVESVSDEATTKIKAGNKIIFKKYAPIEFNNEGKMTYVIETCDVLGILD